MKNELIPAPVLVCVEPNPGPPRRSERLTEEKRWRVIHLNTELQLGPTAIAKRVGVHRNTITALLHKYHETGTVKERPGRGRKRKVSSEDEQRIIKKAKQGKNTNEITREFEDETGIKVSLTTIRDITKAHKLKWLPRLTIEELTEANQAKRLEYARAMSGYNWKKVLFSDEKTFFLGAMRTHAYQEPGKRKKWPVKRHPKKLNVWAAAGAYMQSKLYFFKENMNAPLYQKVIRSHLQEDRITFAADCPPTLPRTYHYLQDNAKWHSAAGSMKALEESVDDRIIEHPAQSPDLNIMEDLWSYLDRKVKAAKITTIQGLKRKLTHEWENLPWSEIRKSVNSMPARLAECVQLEGGRTHY